jgi:23S rRNA (adenine2030-N6)-methyltransferase
MLSYRHGYHAGNFADVLKHSVFVSVAHYLQQKKSALLFVDTHAGGGMYDLAHDYAKKTGEFEKGIGRLWPFGDDMPDMLKPWAEIVQGVQKDESLSRYPGSPFFMRRLLRIQDRAVLFELHSTEAKTLKQEFRGNAKIVAFHDDGLKGLRRMVPPRGPYEGMRHLTLVDPSYEIKTDYDDVPGAMLAAWKRTPQATIIIWYPVIERERTEKMIRRYQRSGIKKLLRIEQGIAEDGAVRGMTAAGLLIINPPYVLADEARAALPWLHEKLGAGGKYLVKELVGES